MPFDALPRGDELTKVAQQTANLQRLYELAQANHGDQRDWDSCLWSSVHRDEMIRARGLALGPCPTKGDGELICDFFGLSAEDMHMAFSAMGIDRKVAYIRELLGERAEATNAPT